MFKKSTADNQLITKITGNDNQLAPEAFKNKTSLPNQHVAVLMKRLNVVTKPLKGSNADRLTVRFKIKSLCLMLGPPAIVLTVNPCDVHSSIVLKANPNVGCTSTFFRNSRPDYCMSYNCSGFHKTPKLRGTLSNTGYVFREGGKEKESWYELHPDNRCGSLFPFLLQK
jgi:hypothetical protein